MVALLVVAWFHSLSIFRAVLTSFSSASSSSIGLTSIIFFWILSGYFPKLLLPLKPFWSTFPQWLFSVAQWLFSCTACSSTGVLSSASLVKSSVGAVSEAFWVATSPLRSPSPSPLLQFSGSQLQIQLLWESHVEQFWELWKLQFW